MGWARFVFARWWWWLGGWVVVVCGCVGGWVGGGVDCIPKSEVSASRLGASTPAAAGALHNISTRYFTTTPHHRGG